MFAMVYGAAFGAIQQIPQMVPGLPEVRQMVQGKSRPRRGSSSRAASDVTKVQEVGGLVGHVILASLAVVIVSRRTLIRMFQIPGLIVMPVVFGLIATSSLSWLYAGAFFAGLLTVGQFSFWGNYCPGCIPCTCAALARASPPTSAAAWSGRLSPG